MKNLRIVFLFGIILFCTVTGTSAMNFTLSDYTVLANSSDPGLVVPATDILPNNNNFSLELSASALHVPLIGNTFGRKIFYELFQWGKAERNGSEGLDFGPDNDGILNVALSETVFTPGFLGLWGNSYRHGVVDASVTHTANPHSAPVPEPATMILLGTGLAGLVAIRRKKLKRYKTAKG